MVKEHPIVIDVLQKRPGSKYTDVPSYLSDCLKEFQQKATPKLEATDSQIDSQPEESKSPSKSSSNEVIRYLESTDAEDEEFDLEVLEFWNRNSSFYPELFQLFKSVACLQPLLQQKGGSVEQILCKRIWETAGHQPTNGFVHSWEFLSLWSKFGVAEEQKIEASIPAEDPESTDSEDEVGHELNENDAEMNSLTQPMSLVWCDSVIFWCFSNLIN